jgi:hypothetical protein
MPLRTAGVPAELDVTAVSREVFSTNRAGETFGFQVGRGYGPTEAEINQRWQELTAAAERQFQDPLERTREIWRLGEVASALLTAVRAQAMALAAVQPGVDRSAVRLRWDQEEQAHETVVPPLPAPSPAPPQVSTPPMPQPGWGAPAQSGRGRVPPPQSPSPQAPRASGRVGRKVGRDTLRMAKKFMLWPFRSGYVKRLPFVPRWMIRLSWLMMILLILQTFYFGITGQYLYGGKLAHPVPPAVTTPYQSPHQGPVYKPPTTDKYRPCIQVSSKPGEEGRCIKWGPAQNSSSQSNTTRPPG